MPSLGDTNIQVKDLKSQLGQTQAELKEERVSRAEAEASHRTAHKLALEERQAALNQVAESIEKARSMEARIAHLESEGLAGGSPRRSLAKGLLDTKVRLSNCSRSKTFLCLCKLQYVVCSLQWISFARKAASVSALPCSTYGKVSTVLYCILGYPRSSSNPIRS